MRYYDFEKAKKIVERYKEEAHSIGLGVYEDWVWSAERIWEKNNWLIKIPDGLSLDVLKEKENERLAARQLILQKYGETDEEKILDIVGESLIKGLLSALVSDDKDDLKEVLGNKKTQALVKELNKNTSSISYSIKGKIGTEIGTPIALILFKDLRVKAIRCFLDDGEVKKDFGEEITDSISASERLKAGPLTKSVQDKIPVPVDEEFD